MNLLQSVTSTVNEVCKRLKKEEDKSKISESRLTPCSVAAVKNGRRKMEDRHVVLHDINMIFEDEPTQKVGFSIFCMQWKWRSTHGDENLPTNIRRRKIYNFIFLKKFLRNSNFCFIFRPLGFFLQILYF